MLQISSNESNNQLGDKVVLLRKVHHSFQERIISLMSEKAMF